MATVEQGVVPPPDEWDRAARSAAWAQRATEVVQKVKYGQPVDVIVDHGAQTIKAASLTKPLFSAKVGPIAGGGRVIAHHVGDVPVMSARTGSDLGKGAEALVPQHSRETFTALGETSKRLGQGARVLGMGASAVGQWRQDADREDLSTGERCVRAGYRTAAATTGGWVGGTGGRVAGAWVGGIIGGILIPGAGAPVGAMIGGLGGGLVGGTAGGKLGDAVADRTIDSAGQFRIGDALDDLDEAVDELLETVADVCTDFADEVREAWGRFFS